MTDQYFVDSGCTRTIVCKDLPKGFQSAEFVKDHGFLDFIVDRRQLKSKLTSLLKIIY